MKLIVGLGNPGKQYAPTRHNMGFDVIDSFAEMAKTDVDRKKYNGLYGIVKNPSFKEDIILAKPETFMNLSGEFVSPLMSFFKIDISDLIVVYDDMAIEEGKIRLRPSGSSGSHKGMQNIIDCLSSDKFKRIRIGIGEPIHGSIDYVLSKPTGESKTKIEEAIKKATFALKDCLLHDFNYAMNHYN